MRQKLLVTGASGFLGWNICRFKKHDFDITGTVFSNPVEIQGVRTVSINLTDFRALKLLFQDVRPDAVIHTAAAASPDYCQQNRSESAKINVDASINMAELCSDYGIPLVFTSTDLVFDGLHSPYRETDPVSPVNIYGEQKVLAEKGVLKTYPAASVCRMPLMFGDAGPSKPTFFKKMLQSFQEGRAVNLFEDEFRTPVSGQTAVDGLILALEKSHGLLHLGGRERVSRYEFGLLLAGVLGTTHAAINKCRQKDMVMPAPRAGDLSLDSSKAFAMGFDPLPLRDELKRLLVIQHPHR